MGKIYLIRHGATLLDPAVSSHNWRLNPDKLDKITQLGEQLKAAEIRTIYTSSEQKTIATAAILAPIWNATIMPPNAGFDEQQRYSAGWFEDAADFRKAVGRLFAYPDQVVFGEESAVQACTRFTAALNALPQSNEPIAIVTHGTVMALYLASVGEGAAESIWLKIQSLGMPMVMACE